MDKVSSSPAEALFSTKIYNLWKYHRSLLPWLESSGWLWPLCARESSWLGEERRAGLLEWLWVVFLRARGPSLRAGCPLCELGSRRLLKVDIRPVGADAMLWADAVSSEEVESGGRSCALLTVGLGCTGLDSFTKMLGARPPNHRFYFMM